MSASKNDIFGSNAAWNWPPAATVEDTDDAQVEPTPLTEGAQSILEDDIAASELRQRVPKSTATADKAESSRPTPPQPSATTSEPQPQSQPRSSSRYMPRQCRICLETIYPTFTAPIPSIPTSLQPKPEVRYISSDPELGRLCKPCLCKGSSKYVHEGCLQQWRYTDPSLGTRNYWECPTCGFRYRLQRLAWGRYVGSTLSQILLTVTILFLVTFFLGFVADPLLNFYSDPWAVASRTGRARLRERNVIAANKVQLKGWNEHFIKGLASMGLLGFAKVIWALGPTGWFNLRSTNLLGNGGGRRATTTGRDRVSAISWVVLVVGIGAFMLAVYKGVNLWSRRVLEKAGERVVDVTPDDDDEDDVFADPAAAAASSQPPRDG